MRRRIRFNVQIKISLNAWLTGCLRVYWSLLIFLKAGYQKRMFENRHKKRWRFILSNSESYLRLTLGNKSYDKFRNNLQNQWADARIAGGMGQGITVLFRYANGRSNEFITCYLVRVGTARSYLSPSMVLKRGQYFTRFGTISSK